MKEKRLYGRRDIKYSPITSREMRREIINMRIGRPSLNLCILLFFSSHLPILSLPSRGKGILPRRNNPLRSPLRADLRVVKGDVSMNVGFSP